MFRQFSFTLGPKQHSGSGLCPTMDDCISPHSSRQSTPCQDEDYFSPSKACVTAPKSITELSRQFDQHTLTSRLPNRKKDYPTPRLREPNPVNQGTNSFPRRVCRQRQSMTRLQCSSAHLSRISALVEDVVQIGMPADNLNRPHPRPTSKNSSSSSISPEEHTASNTHNFGILPPSSAASTIALDCYGVPHCSLSLSQPCRMGQGIRHAEATNGVGEPRIVQKKIRLRKSSKMLSKRTSQRNI